MSSLNNKKLAIFITFGLILLSIFFIGGNQLISMQRRVNNIFEEGSDISPLSIQSQINIISGEASNMLVVSRRYLEHEHELLLPMITSLDNLNNSTNPSDKYIYTNELIYEMLTLNEKRDIIDMSEADINYFQGIIANVESANRIIGNNEYNTIAEEFNQKLESFPASLISSVRRINPSYIYG